MDLTKVRIGCSPITGELAIYRHGKDIRVPLDKREATGEIVTAAAQHLLFGMPTGAVNTVWVPDQYGNDKQVECKILVMPTELFNKKFGDVT